MNCEQFVSRLYYHFIRKSVKINRTWMESVYAMQSTITMLVMSAAQFIQNNYSIHKSCMRLYSLLPLVAIALTAFTKRHYATMKYTREHHEPVQHHISNIIKMTYWFLFLWKKINQWVWIRNCICDMMNFLRQFQFNFHNNLCITIFHNIIFYI